MRSPLRAALALAPLLALPAALPAQERTASAPAGVERIRAAELERQVGWLAADARRGRSTGSPEGVETAHWLAEELEAAGARPAGDDGMYLQRVPLERIVHAKPPALVATTTEGEQLRAAWGEGLDQVAGLPPEGELELRVVRAEEDLPAEADPELALLLEAPAREARAWLRSGRLDGFGLALTGRAQPGRGEAELPRSGLALSAGRREVPRARVRGPLYERLRAGEVRAVRLEADVAREEPEAFNVVGVIPGSGELAAEAVVFSAHHDHVPPRERPAEGSDDVIHNGADDDASGCAAVLALARAFAAGPPPARTLVFLLVTGEEVGLLGTTWYLDHPLVPLERTVCNLNFEMVGRPDALVGGAGRLWLTGAERSNLAAGFAAAGSDVAADARPDQNFFQRSDNYAFALRGVVAQTLSSYDLHGDYHGVDDEADRIDYEHMETALRAVWPGIRALADGGFTPAWLPGGDPRQ